MSWTVVRLVQTTITTHGKKRSSGLCMRVTVAPQRQTFPCRVLIVICKSSLKYRSKSLGCPKHQEPPSFVVDTMEKGSQL